jgi:hypothetical protein
VAIKCFEPVVIPGLVQTEDYARAIHVAGSVSKPDEVDDRVILRMQRQERLSGINPVELHAVIAEASLRPAVGGALIDDDVDVAVVSAMFEEVSRAALSEPESMDFITGVLDEYRADVPTKRRKARLRD